MNKIKLACISSILATGIAHANISPCNGFEIKLTNNLADDLVATTVKLEGGKILPSSIEKLPKRSVQVFTVNESLEAVEMAGQLKFYTLSVPVKIIKIDFILKNEGSTCKYTEKPVQGDYPVAQALTPTGVAYTIG